MTRLQITLPLKSQYDRTPVATEIFDADFKVVWQGTLYVGTPMWTDALPLGRYTIRAYLPLGHLLSQPCTIAPAGPDPLAIELQLPAGAIRRVYRSASGGLESMPTHRGTSDEYTVFAKGITVAPPMLLDEIAKRCWLRLWAQAPTGERWQVVRWFGQWQRVDDNLLQYTFPLPNHGQHFYNYYLQVGGEQIRWRLFALPPTPVTVAFSATARADDPVDNQADSQTDGKATPIRVLVTHVDQTIDALLNYMNSSALDRAGIIAQDLLRGKYDNPLAATVGAYYLLRTGALAERANWAANLARDMSWLADGAVIYAWHLLKQPAPDLADVQRWLLVAVARGLPIYTEGLRLLYDALTLFANQKSPAKDPALEAALARVKPYAAVVDWRAPTVTFPGVDPLTPASTVAPAGAAAGALADPQYTVSLAGDYLD